MPTSNENPSEQFAAVETLLSTWLQERNHVLAKYTHIAIFTESAWDGPALEEQQKDLCALLVDYISAGHFEVFHRLIAEAEAFADGTEKLAENLMPAIADTTEVILAYEEKYSAGPNGPETLERDLSVLGESLESRFVLEDQLIAGLHNTHRQ
ncbi:MAG: regulator of sigma D [Bacteroidia bacterium]|jgi:regulator of sigma D